MDIIRAIIEIEIKDTLKPTIDTAYPKTGKIIIIKRLKNIPLIEIIVALTSL
jgi:hypothetical protein